MTNDSDLERALCERQLDGQWQSTGARDAELLRALDDPETAARFVATERLHGELRAALSPSAGARAAAARVLQTLAAAHEPPVRPRWRASAAVGLGAAAVAAVLGGAFAVGQRHKEVVHTINERDSGGVSLATVTGDVRVDGVTASRGQSVLSRGAVVETGSLASRASLRLPGGGTVLVMADSRISLVGETQGATADPEPRASRPALEIASGSVVLEIPDVPTEPAFTVTTPTSIVEVAPASSLIVTVDVALSRTRVAVGKGEARVGGVTVPPGHYVLVDAKEPARVASLSQALVGDSSGVALDFEDGRAPDYMLAGDIVEGPPREGSRYAVRAAPYWQSVGLRLLRRSPPIASVRPGLVLTFDYWAADDVDVIGIRAFTRPREIVWGINMRTLEHGRWATLSVPIESLIPEAGTGILGAGDAITGLRIRTDQTTPPRRLYFDNVRFHLAPTD